MRSITFLLVVILIAACTPSQVKVVQTLAVEPTAVPTIEPTIPPTVPPTAEPTLVPLPDLDLESVIPMGPHDLPTGLTFGQIRDELPGMFDGLPTPINQIYAQFERDNHAAGGVSIILYDTDTLMKESWDFILEGMGGQGQTQPIAGLGERSRQGIGDWLFLRCNAVVHVRMPFDIGFDDRWAYTKTLDANISELICR